MMPYNVETLLLIIRNISTYDMMWNRHLCIRCAYNWT